MSVVTVRVDEDLKAKMEKLKHVNWSEVIRRAIAERVVVEETLAARRTINVKLLEEAMRNQDLLRTKTTGRWSGVEEIRRWRELRR